MALEILYEQVAPNGQAAPGQLASQEVPVQIPSRFIEMTFGEEIDAPLMEGLDSLDFQDMSWLTSVPSNLF